jgi:hypothetical protein
MKLTADFARGFCVGMGLIGIAALAAARGFPNPRIWRIARVLPSDRATMDRTLRNAQKAPDYLDICRLDICRAAGL